MRMILLGPPGSGKGTLAEALCQRYPFIHVSTGNLFRQHIANGSPLGLEIRSYMDQGELVPDELTVKLVEEVLQDPKIREHFLLDGFPRTQPQAALFDQCLKRLGVKLDAALHVHVPDTLIKQRLGGRRVCQGCGKTYHIESYPEKVSGVCDSCGGAVILRPDDRPEVIEKRLKTYHEITAPLVEYYRKQGNLLEVDNSGSIESVLEQLQHKWPHEEQ